MNVQTQAFLESPNSALGCPHARLAHTDGISGTEFFGYDTVRALFRDDRIRPKTAQVYLDMGVTKGSPIYEFLQRGNFNMMPQEDHDRLRPLILRGFRPARIRTAEPAIQQIADGLVDQIITSGGTANLVADFSHHLSIRTISHFIGVPAEDVHRFEDATVELILLGAVPFAPAIPRLEEALVEISTYVDSLVTARRVQPGDDFISDLIALESEGDKITQEELVWSIVFLLLAGHDTTRAQIASTARLLISTGQRDAAAEDDTLVKQLLKESLRIYPAAHRFPRVVREPLEVEGLSFEPGDRLALNLAAAGRDPSVFENPDDVVLDRPAPGYEIGFGYGGHHCIGWGLATAEITIGVQTLVDRLTNVDIVGDVVYKTGGTIAGPEVLDITFSPRTAAR
ncbi:cytochrome P450 [Agromyces sp. NPDC058484]|uniref:cytochrome P450 n=1 Tax=Agromyces sp. NPDC058484 TaxID=3346524 RepID=UPI00366660E1